MEIKEKLAYIKEFTGYSQEELARRFGVSFVAFSNWINGHAKPRPKKRAEIEEYYRLLAGDGQVADSILTGKKDRIKNEQTKYPGILALINSRDDLKKQFILDLTYNSNKIEGSTLSEDETAAILFDNAIIPNKELVEHMEARNHQAALEYLFSWVGTGASVGEELALKLHGILMNGIRSDAGSYRRHGVRIVGANIPTANYIRVPELMAEWDKEVKAGSDDIIRLAARTHSRFEHIHPFADGNGRVGRLILHALMLKNDLPPVLVGQDKKRLYYAYLNKSQRMGDSSLLEDFFCDCVLGAYKLIDESK